MKKFKLLFIFALALILSVSVLGCETSEVKKPESTNTPKKQSSAEKQSSSSDKLNAAPEKQSTDGNTSKGKKIILTTGEWAPFTSEKLEGKGFASEIVASIFKEMGEEFEIQFYPWERGQKMVENGEAWAAFPYYRTAEREKIFTYSDVLFDSVIKYYYVKDKNVKVDLSFNDLSDLKKYKFAGVNGYFYQDKFKQNGMNVEWVQGAENAVQMLGSGRVDFMIEDQLVAKDLFKKYYPNEMDKFQALSKTWGKDPMHLLVSKKYPDADKILKKFNDALKAIRGNGVYKKIFEKYGLSE